MIIIIITIITVKIINYNHDNNNKIYFSEGGNCAVHYKTDP